MISAEIKNQEENIVMEASFGVSFSWNVSQMKFFNIFNLYLLEIKTKTGRL